MTKLQAFTFNIAMAMFTYTAILPMLAIAAPISISAPARYTLPDGPPEIVSVGNSLSAQGSNFVELAPSIFSRVELAASLIKRAENDILSPTSSALTENSIYPKVPETHLARTPAEATDLKKDNPTGFAAFVQGFKNFFAAVKNWFKSDNKGAFFRDLGRKFVQWFKNIKAKFSARKATASEGKVAEMDGANPVLNSEFNEGKLSSGKTWEEVEAVTAQNINTAQQRGEAERLIKELDAEIEGLFDDENTGSAMDIFVNRDYDKQKEANAASINLPVDPEDGPTRGITGTFSSKDKKKMDVYQEAWEEGILHPAIPPPWKTGIRKDPTTIGINDAIFIEQGIDPTKLSRKDHRNYQILFEWYKDMNKAYDVTHPNHKDVYDGSSNPIGVPDLFGKPAYHEQKEDLAPIPYLRENNKKMSFGEKLASFFTYGVYSNDPNRPSWWWNQLALFSRDNEVEDWIEKNIPAAWMDAHFPLGVGPATKHHWEYNVPSEVKSETIQKMNDFAVEAANRANLKVAQRVHEDAMRDASWAAYTAGQSQMKASGAVPKPEELVNNRDLFEDLKAKTYQKERELWKLHQLNRMHDQDVDKLNSRLRENGVVVVDNKHA